MATRQERTPLAISFAFSEGALIRNFVQRSERKKVELCIFFKSIQCGAHSQHTREELIFTELCH